MKTTRFFRLTRIAAVSAALLVGATSGHAGLTVPYVPDADTLHLWHFDDPTNNQGTVNFVTETDAVAAAGITLTNYGASVANGTGATVGPPPYNNIFLVPQAATANLKGSLEVLAIAGEGSAGKAYAYAGTSNNIGGYFSDTTAFRNPVSGAFTFEALVYIQGPVFSTSIGNEWELVCGDSQGESGGRAWQFRMQPGATPSLNINFITQTGGSATPNVSPLLPVSGPDALSVSNWYHVAVTYTGNAPTNGDTAGVLRFYWTFFDPYRTNADLLASFTNTAYGTLGGGPVLAIGGSGRRNNGIGNAGSFEGLMDEVRISDIARGPDQMVFTNGGAQVPPSFTAEPPASALAGYSKGLTLSTLVSGSPPIFYTWQKTNNASGGWTNVPGQTDNSLQIGAVTFADAGLYRLVATNAVGSTNSTTASVTVGAAFNETFNTGFDTNGVYEPTNLPGNPDPHYTLLRSPDVNLLGPNALVWNMFQYPIAANGGFFANPDGASQWIGPQFPNGGTYTSMAGQYVYRTSVLLDSVDLTQPVKLTGTWWTGNEGIDILVNGQSTGITGLTNSQSTGSPFVITSGFKPGVNTLDFVVPTDNPGGSYPENAVRVELSGIGQALAASLPVITNQPADVSVRDANQGQGDKAAFSVVALGRPPLSYQWWADGNLLTGATRRTLSYDNPTAGAQGSSFTVVVSNDSGSVTSRVASLTLTANHPPTGVTNYTYVIYTNQTLAFNLAAAYYAASDPDGDALSLTYDGVSTNGVPLTLATPNLTYAPAPDYLGHDAFSYAVSDGIVSVQGNVYLTVAAPLSPTISGAAVSGQQFVWHGSGGVPGGGYHILSSTDVTMPVGGWSVAGAANFDSGGNFTLSTPISVGEPVKFFMLQVP